MNLINNKPSTLSRIELNMFEFHFFFIIVYVFWLVSLLIFVVTVIICFLYILSAGYKM